MRRVGFILKVKADRLEEYKKHHQNVWPDMLAALRAAGWRNYSLFMRDDGTLFGYFETPVDLKTAQESMEKAEVNARWQAMMSPFFEIPPGAHPDQTLVELEEVFHTD